VIVCLKCGHHNRDDAEWCAKCETFLEFDGERVATTSSAASGETQPAAKRGLIRRIKDALGRQPDKQ
jgi:hypothetical protein